MARIIFFTESVSTYPFDGRKARSWLRYSLNDAHPAVQRNLMRPTLATEFDPLLVIPSAPTRAGGYDSVPKLLQIEDRPNAVLCFNDRVALGVIEVLKLAGVEVGCTCLAP